MFYIGVGIYFRDIGLNKILLKLIPPISFDFNVAITKFSITCEAYVILLSGSSAIERPLKKNTKVHV